MSEPEIEEMRGRAEAVLFVLAEGGTPALAATQYLAEAVLDLTRQQITSGTRSALSPVELYEADGRVLGDAPARTQEILRRAEASHRRQAATPQQQAIPVEREVLMDLGARAIEPNPGRVFRRVAALRRAALVVDAILASYTITPR